MISIYQNSFISYTNLITYFVLPCLQQNQIIVQNGAQKTLSPLSDNDLLQNEQNFIKNGLKVQIDSPAKEISHFITMPERQNSNNKTSQVSQKNMKKSKRKTEKKQHIQKYGRNICSNIFHIIIKKVLYEKDYDQVILRMIQKFQMSIKLQQFYSKLYFKQNKLKQYVPFDKIIEFYSGAKNKIKESIKKHAEFCKILRVVSRLYLQNEHIAEAFYCQKLKKESKNFHIKQSRKLYSIMRGTYKQDYKS